MLALCGIAATFYWTDWAHAHGSVMFRVFVISGIAFVLCVGYLVFAHDTPKPISPPPIPEMKMEASGYIMRSPQIGTVHGNVYLGDQSPIHSVATPIPTPARPEPVIPHLVWTPRFKYIEYMPGDAAWREVQYLTGGSSYEALLIAITNPMPSPGQPPLEAPDLAAHIVFTSMLAVERTIETPVSRAHWMDHPSNEITLAVGETGRIVVCVENYGQWVAYANARQRAGEINDPFYDPFFPLAPKILIPTEQVFGFVRIDITLYSSSLNRVIQAKKYRLRRTNNHRWGVEEMSDET